MNTDGFTFTGEAQAFLDSLQRGGRLPHAVMIESADGEKAAQLATFLSMYAVCAADDPPCGVCKNCRNARDRHHADVAYPQPDKKNKSKKFDVDHMRALAADAYILPNEASSKVYIFEKADERFPVLVQNTFLKTFEEPPQNVYFILLCQSSRAFLDTILSRFTLIRVQGEATADSEAEALSRAIADGILDSREYPLLQALYALCDEKHRDDKERTERILAALKLHFRDALALLSGADALGEKDTAKRLAARLTRKKLLELLEKCDSFASRLQQNVNTNLLTTWLCGEFRRILWQR